MNFKEIKTKILLEKFVSYCKTNNVTRKDIENVSSIFNNKNYLNEGPMDWLANKAQGAVQWTADKLYKFKLNKILKQITPILTSMNKTSSDVENLIQTYNLSNDQIASDALRALNDLKQPYTDFQTKVNNLSTTAATGMRSDAASASASNKNVNYKLIQQYVSDMITLFTSNSPPAATDPTSKENIELFSKAVKDYFEKANPQDLENAKKILSKNIAKAKNNNSKLYQVIDNIAKTTGTPVARKNKKIINKTEARNYLIQLWDKFTWIKPIRGGVAGSDKPILEDTKNKFSDAYEKFIITIGRDNPSMVDQINKNIYARLALATRQKDAQKQAIVSSLIGTFRNPTRQAQPNP